MKTNDTYSTREFAEVHDIDAERVRRPPSTRSSPWTYAWGRAYASALDDTQSAVEVSGLRVAGKAVPPVEVAVYSMTPVDVSSKGEFDALIAPRRTEEEIRFFCDSRWRNGMEEHDWASDLAEIEIPCICGDAELPVFGPTKVIFVVAPCEFDPAANLLLAS